MKKFIFISIVFCITTNIYSFPGDHNSLTCVDKLFVNSFGEIKDASDLQNYLASDDPEKVKIARQYVKDNLETIKNQIRKHHDFETDITMWGDSLTDLIDYYGVVPSNFFGGFYPKGDFGNEQGFMDSWADYFTIFTNSYDEPFKVRNYATSMHKTIDLLGRVNTSLGHIDGIWDVLPDKNHCIEEQMVGDFSRQQYMFDPSSPRSVLMIGGNDIMMQAAFFPFLDKYKVEETLENITFVIDWNIENGKQVFLQGNLPAYAKPLAIPYNSILVNRESICRPLEDSLIEPDEIPWYVCAFDAGLCAAMVQSSLVHNANVTKAFNDFSHMIFAGPYLEKDGAKGPNHGDILMTMSSINLACVNDRLANSIALSYKTVYPDNVKFHLLYNHFNKTGADMSAQNFWVPIDGLFGKHPDYNEPMIDTIHIGPHGYKVWSIIMGNKLKSIGWNEKTSADEMPDPVIELEGGGPGRKIRKKAKEVNLFGKESTGLMPISSELAPYDGLKYGGFYRQYWNEDRIYIQQIKNATVDVPMKERYGEAYHLKGVLLEKYLEINGTLTLGFPMSDTLNVGPAGTFRRIFFECGYMTHNTLDSGSPGNYTINGREACPALKNNDPNYKPDFTNCLSEGECTGRWFEDYVFQLEPTVGNSPFRFEMTENNYGFPGKLDRVGRIRGGPTNNATGYWTITVKMKDARGKESEEKTVHISTGW